ncbi:transglycosylase domain-containing protein, partial [Pseudonocardia acidicola]|uniref:transglycosylase domain-containing protein n=1 Tax=Pseudonocardia acidicola TaxID=2724939 RepID=UPI0030845FDC
MTLGAFVTGPVLAFLIGCLCFRVPTPDDAVSKQVATVSYDDGSQLAKIVPAQGNRTDVGVDQIPLEVRDAVLSAEDRTFYSNPGFDLTGIFRAAWSQLRGGVGGGSTITQQYVKKTLVGDEHSLWRKYKEVVIAFKLSQRESKDQILGDYLNAIYFGRGAYGIQAAARTYFGKSVSQLDVSQGALLAALIQSPSQWDPAIDPVHAQERWNYVMDGMVSQGWLTPQQRATESFPPTLPRRPVHDGSPTDSRGLIVDAVERELSSLGISEQELTHEGLRITTTIDPAMQQHAVDTEHTVLADQPRDLRSALVSIDPRTGGIRAYYGGDDGVGLDYAEVEKQPGSTFKPFVLLAALQQDPPIGLGTVMSGEPFPGLHNADPGATCDQCNLKQAMTISNNVVFYTLARKIGPQKVADAAHQAGITEPLPDPTEGIALGNKEVTPVELASAYATFAADGTYRPPHLVTKVVTSDNRVLYQAGPDGEQRISPRVTRNVTEAMLDVAGHDHIALSGGRPVAAKSGTVQSRFPNQNNDAWFAGFTPSLSTAVWIGTDHNDPIQTRDGTPISGDGLPGEIWHGFVNSALASTPVQDFPPLHPLGQPIDDHAASAPSSATPTTSSPPSPPPSPASTPSPTPGPSPMTSSPPTP